MNEPQNRNIQVEADNQTLKGIYANNLLVSHTKEEFVLDYMLVHPPKGMLMSRVIVSPSHFKRIARAVQENLKKYEQHFGEIPDAKGPNIDEVGFKA